MIRAVFLVLLFLSTGYTTQKVVASPAAFGQLAKQLPLSLQTRRAKTAQILDMLSDIPNHWSNFQALLLDGLPIVSVLSENAKYSRLRGSEQHQLNLVKHLMTSSHAELNRIITLLSFDVETVLPRLNSLSWDDTRTMVGKLSEYRLRSDVDVSFAELSRTAREEHADRVSLEISTVVHGVVDASIAGHGRVFTSFQKLYEAQKFEELHDIFLATWRRHYHVLYLVDRAAFTATLQHNMPTVSGKLAMANKESLPESLRAGFAEEGAEELEMLKEMVATIASPASRQAAVEYLTAKSAPRIAFGDRKLVELRDADASHLDALEELGLMENILLLIRGLDKPDLRYLARELGKPQ